MFSVDGMLKPRLLAALILILIKAFYFNPIGCAVKVFIGTVQNRLAIIYASAPSHYGVS